MKTKEQIFANKFDLIKKLSQAIADHKKLSQIDMLSGEGSQLREKINQLEGAISILNWVLADNEGNPPSIKEVSKSIRVKFLIKDKFDHSAMYLDPSPELTEAINNWVSIDEFHYVTYV